MSHINSLARLYWIRSEPCLMLLIAFALLLLALAGNDTRAQSTLPDESSPEIIYEEDPAPDGGGDVTAAAGTSNQPSFVGNAPNVQANIVDFSEINPKTGAYTFTINVDAPPGVNGLKPNVAIVYSSDGPQDGLLGVGFSATIEDCIQRKGPGRQLVDGSWVFGHGLPEFSDNDIFYLNNQRLVPCDQQAGGPTASCPVGTYRTELNDFAKVEKRPAGVPNGFKVHKPDGTIVEYAYGRLGYGRSDVFSNYTHYCVSKIVKDGNEIRYNYVDYGFGFRPLDYIDYGGVASNPHKWRIRFEWENRLADEVRENWSSGTLVKVTKRLRSIEVLTLPSLSRVRKYVITYDPALSPDGGRSRVQRIQEFGTTDADFLPAHQFTYPPAGSRGWTGSSWQYGGPASAGFNIENAFVNTGYTIPGLPNSGLKQYMLGTYVADLNADGLPDLVRHDDQVSQRVWLNRGPTAAVQWTEDATWNSKFASIPPFFGSTPPNVYDQGVRIFDLNGDTYPDIIQAGSVIPPCSGTHTTPNAFFVALYDPVSGQYRRDLATAYENFFRNNNITFTLFSRENVCPDGYVIYQDGGIVPADVNADGLVDLVIAREGYIDTRFPDRTEWIARRQVWLNNGTTFVSPPLGTFQFPVDFLRNGYLEWSRYYGVHVADINGDSLPDIVQVVSRFNGFGGPLAEKTVKVWLHNGTGWTLRNDWATVINTTPLSNDRFNIHEYDTLPAYPWIINYPMGSAMLDLNGDQIEDFARGYCWSTNCGYFFTYLSKANGQWTQDSGYQLPSQLIKHRDGLIYAPDWDGAFRFADVNRDGLVDLVGNGLFARNDAGQEGQAGFLKINNMRVDRDLITGVITPLGGTVTIAYAPASTALNPSLPFPKIVVNSITLHNGRSGGAANGEWSSNKLYVYMGGRYDNVRREFAGFRVVSVRSSIEGQLSYRTSWYANSKADACHPGEEEFVTESELFCPPGPFCFINTAGSNFNPNVTPTTVSNFKIHRFTTNVYPTCFADTLGPFFSPLRNTTTKDFNPSQSSLEVVNHTRYWYDSFGNQVAAETLRNPSDTTTYRDSWTTYIAPSAGGPWILDKPCASGSITPQNGANLARTATYFYYDNLSTMCQLGAQARLTGLDQYAWDGKTYFTPMNFVGRRTFQYTPAGNLSAVTNERGFTTTIYWDSSLPEILPRAIRDASLATTQFAYDSYGNTWTATDPNLMRGEIRYDNLHRPVHVWVAGANPADPAPDQTISYQNFGSPSTQRTVVTNKLDAARNINHETYFDGMGRTYLELRRNGSDALATSHLYNSAGAEFKITLPYNGTTFSLNQPLTQYDYDAIGRLIKVTLPGAYTANTSYNLRNDGTQTYFWQTLTFYKQTTLERKRHLLYDQFERLTVVTECEQTTCADPIGSTDTSVHHTYYFYDGADNLVEVRMSDGDPAHGISPSSIRRFFDGLGRLIAYKDPNSSNCFDSNPADVASGCPWRYEYDANNNLVRTLDPIYATQSNFGAEILLGYDALDRLTTKHLRAGNVDASYSFTYDADVCGSGGAYRGRLSTEYYQSERPLELAGTPNEIASPIRASGPVNIVQKNHCYDSLGRRKSSQMTIDLVGIASYGPYSLLYSYQNNNANSGMQTPDGQILTFGFDNLGRYKSLTTNNAGTVVSNVLYDLAGRLDTITFGTSFNQKLEYRTTAAPVADQRLKKISTPGRSILDLTFDYDAAGNVTSLVNAITGNADSFDYDRLDRLTRYYSNAQLFKEFVYDSLGNRRTHTTVTYPAADEEIIVEYPWHREPWIEPVPGPMSSSSYSDFGTPYEGVAGAHALTCVGPYPNDPCQSAFRTFEYDGNGNLLFSTESGAAGSTVYGYDLENRLRTITMPNGQYAHYYYGPAGEKVAVNDNGVVSVFVDPAYHIKSGAPVHHYFLGDKRVGIKEQGQGLKYILSDNVGSTRAVVDAATINMIQQLDYYPFGEALTEAGPYQCAYRFDGQFRDQTGHYDFKARHYIPEHGIFIQPDTVVPDYYDPQSLNRYAFPNNNPVTLGDPSGHEGEDWPSDVYLSISYPFSYDPFQAYLMEQYYMNAWWMDAAGFKSILERDPLDYYFTKESGPSFHPPELPPVNTQGYGGYSGAPDLPLEGPGLIDPVDFMGAGLLGAGKGLVQGTWRAAAQAGAAQAGKVAVQLPLVRGTMRQLVGRHMKPILLGGNMDRVKPVAEILQYDTIGSVTSFVYKRTGFGPKWLNRFENDVRIHVGAFMGREFYTIGDDAARAVTRGQLTDMLIREEDQLWRWWKVLPRNVPRTGITAPYH